MGKARDYRSADFFARRAAKEGYVARSVYKLAEIDARRKLFRTAQRVLDLGCAPGSWMQYASRAVGSEGLVIGVDLLPLRIALPPQARSIVGDVLQCSAEVLCAESGRVHVLLSDMAPQTIGVPSADAARSAILARRGLELAEEVLLRGGILLVKILEGELFPALRADFQARFRVTHVERPAATRSGSRERFLLGCGWRGRSVVP